MQSGSFRSWCLVVLVLSVAFQVAIAAPPPITTPQAEALSDMLASWPALALSHNWKPDELLQACDWASSGITCSGANPNYITGLYVFQTPFFLIFCTF